MKYSTALYCRLSREDMDTAKNGNQSDSIENQQLLLEGYIEKNSDEFQLYGIYADDGITGMTYDRAAFNRMMTEVYSGNINCIIVKDLSRIGREQVETLNLIRKEFIIRNIRFIAITDDYDSLNPSKSDGLSTSVKLLLNDYYCADISKKVRAAQRAKMEHGDFIGSYAPYGYVKSSENKNKLVIDERAATVVRQIFNLYLSGMGKLAIAKVLNSRGIPNPTTYKQTVLHEKYVNANNIPSNRCWSYSTINHILKNQLYIGDTVQHKSEIKAYNIHKKVALPKEEWCIAKNTHEAIISREDFEAVQRLLSAKSRKLDLNNNVSKYSGLFFCKECKRRMNKYLSKQKKDGSRYNSFKCSTYSALGKESCTIHSIREDELDKIVLTEIKKALAAALDAEGCAYIIKNTTFKLNTNISKQMKELRARLYNCENKRSTMLNHLSEGIITALDFKTFDNESKSEKDKIQKQISELNNKLNNQNKQLNEFDSWLNNLLQHKNIDHVSRELLVNMVDKIFISEQNGKKEVEIIFKFKNPLE